MEAGIFQPAFPMSAALIRRLAALPQEEETVQRRHSSLGALSKMGTVIVLRSNSRARGAGEVRSAELDRRDEDEFANKPKSNHRVAVMPSGFASILELSNFSPRC
jgi:hypothetical protein